MRRSLGLVVAIPANDARNGKKWPSRSLSAIERVVLIVPRAAPRVHLHAGGAFDCAPDAAGRGRRVFAFLDARPTSTQVRIRINQSRWRSTRAE